MTLRTFSISLLGALFVCAPYAASAEIIRSYDTQLTLQTSGALHVVETIRYDFEDTERHGIYREIPRHFRAEGVEDRGISIDHVVVTDALGTEYQTAVDAGNKILNIRVGDPDVTLTGAHTYVITYDVRGAVIPLANGDEIYWDAIGGEWDVPIEKATAEVRLPSATSIISSACYVGERDAKESCVMTAGTAFVHFEAVAGLAKEEGMTVAVAFPKGTVPVEFIEPPHAGISGLPHLPSIVFIVSGILIGLLGLAFAFRMWSRHGRDPRGRGTIIPYYEAPKNLTPMEAGLLVRHATYGRDITAEVISLARQGAFKIVQETDTTLGIFKSTDYRLVDVQGEQVLKAHHEKDLYNALFANAESENGVRSLLISTIDKTAFYKALVKLKEAVRASVIAKGLYDGASKKYVIMLAICGVLALLFTFVGFILGISMTDTLGTLALCAGLGIAGIAMLLAAALMPRVTREGALIKEELLGLKDYLRIAEKDRLAFHNAPNKRPEVFEMLLPFAIMFGVEKAWAKEFEGIQMPQPQWYSGNTAAFSAVAFTNDMNAFATSFTSAIAVSASGSGGAGSVGGGGGGGGGGSW